MKRFTQANRRRRSKALSPALKAYLAKTDRLRAGRDPLTLMRGAPARLNRAVAGLSAAKLRKRPAKGTWCIQEIVGHLMDTEVVYAYRWHMAFGQSGSPIQGYDQDVWIREEGYRNRKWSVRAMVDHIAAMRRATLYYLERLPRAEKTKRHGMHSERGRETVRRTEELIAGHDINHLEQIRAIKKKYGW
ncbi:MAG TPA: DinB family protein [Acidobacteriota bacterium]|nr:DinB family protein [Acidobacteriota bacterium]